MTASDEQLGGMFGNVALLDIASMHPSSIEDMNLFGPYTKRFSEIKKARILIKHKKFDEARTMLDGAFADILDDKNQDPKALAAALKIAINSVYGLTSARFPTKFNDAASGMNDRNKDNKVAKRGALFMIKLKHEVQKQGYTVVHIKTDSIKIADADQYIIDYVMDFGHMYGYNFEHEASYDKMCIVNKSTYIAHGMWGEHAGEWTATGLQFQVPYVFKTLFSHEDLVFSDFCETKSVKSSMYLDFNEGLSEDEHRYSFVGKVSAFTPVKSGCGGGILLREAGEPGEAKYAAVTGTKGYRWKESSILRDRGLEDEADRSYYENLANEAVATISQYGDFDWLVGGEEYVSPNPKSNELAARMRKGEYG